MQVELYEVKGVTVELMINGSYPDTQRFGHDGFTMAEEILVEV